MRVFVGSKLVQRSWQDDSGNKRYSVEIQVTHVGPDLQFQSTSCHCPLRLERWLTATVNPARAVPPWV
jgi:hypothetical protein